MSECRLVLVDYWPISKAPKFFWLFKPSECIQGEPFDLYLIFKNNSKQKFEGGKCKLKIRNKLEYPFVVNIPPIEPNEEEEVTVPNINLAEVGFIALGQLYVETERGKVVSCDDTEGRTLSKPEGVYYPWFLAPREEIYQKYAVVVALIFSVLASILTIVNVLVSIFK